MLAAKTEHSCVVDSKRNYLYVISGTPDGNTVLTSVDRISIDTIYSADWNHWCNLPYAVIYSDNIIVIGGADAAALQIINCIDNKQVSSSLALKYSVYGAATIISNNKIYVTTHSIHGKHLIHGNTQRC